MDTTVHSTPEELGKDLTALTATDWPTLWRGDTNGDPIEFCRTLGWKFAWYYYSHPTAIEVIIPTGTHWDLSFGHLTAGTQHLERHLMQLHDVDAAQATEETLRRWERYLASATSVLGEPNVLTAWDAPDFPDNLWGRSRKWRLKKQSPHRLAVWHPTDADGPTHELWINRVVDGNANSVIVRIASPDKQ